MSVGIEVVVWVVLNSSRAFARGLMGCKRKPDRLFRRLSLFLQAAKSSADSGQK